MARIAPPTPLAYRVEDAGAVIGIGKSKVWELINEGRLPARRIDGATIIRHADLKAFLEATPLTDSAKRAQSARS